MLADAARFNVRVAQFNALAKKHCESRGVEFRSIDPDGPVAGLRVPDGVHFNAVSRVHVRAWLEDHTRPATGRGINWAALNA